MYTAMELRCIFWFSLTTILASVCALPTSLVDEIKANELSGNKVKRARPEIASPEERVRDVPYYSKPTAIKRGATINKSPSTEEQSLGEWEQDHSQHYDQDDLTDLQSGLYTGVDNPFDDKTIAEYEKGFHYGTSKDKLDEALENAVLKSELYGEPSSLNQYRYYGLDDRRRRRRREAARKMRLDNRIKREVELTPEELLAILTLYENERQQKGYRTPWRRPEQNYDFEKDDNDIDQDDENWLDTPVYPHATSRVNDIGSNYYYDEKPQAYEKRGRWGGYADRTKRFMITKKRDDPMRELRYLNGPNKNDFYTLSQLLNNDREPNVPVYHRLVL